MHLTILTNYELLNHKLSVICGSNKNACIFVDSFVE